VTREIALRMPRARSGVRRTAAGFTLLEACLAFGALALGLLALAQFQFSLLASVEAARDAGQALRLAQATLERERGFTALEPAPDARAFAQISSFTQRPAHTAGGPREAQITLDVTDHPALHHKAVQVTVSWRDRLGRERAVRLGTLIAAVVP
jgi:hypothetical protein